MYVKNALPSCDYDPDEVLLKVDCLSGENDFRNISFEGPARRDSGHLRVDGRGVHRMVETIFGLRKATAGTVTMKGAQGIHSPR